jgi:hypothetical protein
VKKIAQPEKMFRSLPLHAFLLGAWTTVLALLAGGQILSGLSSFPANTLSAFFD